MEATIRKNMIKKIDSKLEILVKNMNDDEYNKFMNDNKIVDNYNTLLNQICLGIMPESMEMFLTEPVLKKVNNIVLNEVIKFSENKTELVLN